MVIETVEIPENQFNVPQTKVFNNNSISFVVYGDNTISFDVLPVWETRQRLDDKSPLTTSFKPASIGIKQGLHNYGEEVIVSLASVKSYSFDYITESSVEVIPNFSRETLDKIDPTTSQQTQFYIDHITLTDIYTRYTSIIYRNFPVFIEQLSPIEYRTYVINPDGRRNYDTGITISKKAVVSFEYNQLMSTPSPGTITGTTISGIIPRSDSVCSQMGDIDGDGIVSMKDAMYLAKYVVGLPGYELTSIQKILAEVDGYSGITMGDAMFIAKYSIGLPGFTTFPACDKNLISKASFTSKPPNADIYINDAGAWIYIGKTPITTTLVGYDVEYKLTSTGYKDYTTKKSLIVGTINTFSDTLSCKSAILTIDSNPRGAGIHVNNVQIGHTPTTVDTGICLNTLPYNYCFGPLIIGYTPDKSCALLTSENNSVFVNFNKKIGEEWQTVIISNVRLVDSNNNNVSQPIKGNTYKIACTVRTSQDVVVKIKITQNNIDVETIDLGLMNSTTQEVYTSRYITADNSNNICIGVI